MTTEPRTEAGRRYGFYVDPDEDHPRSSVRAFDTVWHAIRDIEDEAARKERERLGVEVIEAIKESITGADALAAIYEIFGYDDPNDEAAITDTGEENR